MKRKLSDLKENERICVENEKQAKGLRRLLKKQGYSHGVSSESVLDIDFVRTNCHHIKISCKNYYYQQSDFDKSYPASDFIKPKRSNSKRIKRLESEVDRLNVIVTNLAIPSGGSVNGIMFEPAAAVEPKELEVGKWYKWSDTEFPEFLGCFTGLDEDKDFRYYGFNSGGSWHDNDYYEVADYNYVLATKEEVKSALIAEAERRYGNVKIGNVFKGNWGDEEVTMTINEDWYFDDSFNIFTFGKNGVCLLSDGKWAEIIQENEIDWSVPQLVYIKNNILQTTGVHDEEYFEGTVIFQRNVTGYKRGKHSTEWRKNKFRPLEGEITLKNE